MARRTTIQITLLTAIALIMIVLGGCSKAEETPALELPDIPRDPITLTVLQSNLNISDTEFEKMMKEPTKVKYPHITLELVRTGGSVTPENLVASGNMSDIIFTSSGTGINNFWKLGVPIDLTDLMKSHKMDEAVFDSVAIDKIKAESYGELFALPFSINFSVLYYNKEIFDRFGVSYPRDLMMWEDAIELAKQVTRVEDGKQYAGFDSLDVGRYGRQMSLPIIHYDTVKAAFVTDGWKRAFEVFKGFKDIPGNSRNVNFLDAFLKNRDLAMIVAYGAVVGMLEELHNNGDPLDWDIVTVPQFREAPERSWEIDLHTLMVSSTTPHREDAFKVVSLLTADEEVQKAMTREGRLTSLVNKDVLNAFGTNLKSLEGKNAEAVFKISPAVGTPPSPYKEIAYRQIVPAFNRVMAGADINTALREAEELANRDIAAELAK